MAMFISCFILVSCATQISFIRRFKVKTPNPVASTSTYHRPTQNQAHVVSTMTLRPPARPQRPRRCSPPQQYRGGGPSITPM